jgi:cytochrome c
MKRSFAGVCVVLAITIMGAALASSARALVPDGDQGWYWQMPQPVGALLDSVAFPTADTMWALGEGPLLSTVDTSDDTAASSTIASHADSAWHNKPVTITLSASDIGGSQPVSTQYSLDGGLTWQTGTSITVDAPADHSGDGENTILYRSTDAAGNREATQVHSVMIDTLGPTCSAPKKAVVGAGKQGIIRFEAADDTSGVARATISIVNARGRVMRSFVERAANGWSGSGIPYFWLRFTCRLKPGTYGIEVRAVDFAGNPQTQVGRNTLRVVTSGAPRPQHPPWPSGLGKAGRPGSSGSRDLGLRLRGSLSPRLRSAAVGIL